MRSACCSPARAALRPPKRRREREAGSLAGRSRLSKAVVAETKAAALSKKSMVSKNKAAEGPRVSADLLLGVLAALLVVMCCRGSSVEKCDRKWKNTQHI